MRGFTVIYIISSLVIISLMILILHEQIHSTFCEYFNGESDRVIHFNFLELYVTCTIGGPQSTMDMFDMVSSFWDMATYLLMFIVIVVYSMKFIDCLRDEEKMEVCS